MFSPRRRRNRGQKMIDTIKYLETQTEKYPLAFTLNVMEEIQEKYGDMDKWSNLIQGKKEPNIRALKFFITKAINEGLEIENEKTGKKRKLITEKQTGRILTEIGLNKAAKTVAKTITDCASTEKPPKNGNATKNQA